MPQQSKNNDQTFQSALKEVISLVEGKAPDAQPHKQQEIPADVTGSPVVPSTAKALSDKFACKFTG